MYNWWARCDPSTRIYDVSFDFQYFKELGSVCIT
jgi:hypothetical protein